MRISNLHLIAMSLLLLAFNSVAVHGDEAAISSKSLKDSTNSANSISSNLESKTIDWIDLLPPDSDREALMEHYADLVIQRLDPNTERVLQQKIIAELNQAPANPDLNGIQIRLAGYMIVLDEQDGHIQEFILVPYSGAGIHQPAPPANQMILVKPSSEVGLSSSDPYQAVWIEGQVKVQETGTSVAPVAYLMENAQVRWYSEADAKQAEAAQSAHEHADEHAHED